MTTNKLTDERIVKILYETQATITEHNSRCVHGSVEVDARLFEGMLMELQERRKAQGELESFRTAFMEFHDKTDWVQEDKRFDVLKPWGKHRADVLKEFIEHLETKNSALAAENTVLKQFPDQIVSFIGKLGSSEMGRDTKEKIEAAANKVKTPATDAFLAEVRASAIEHAASERWGSGYVFDELNEFAAQLRKGVQS